MEVSVNRQNTLHCESNLKTMHGNKCKLFRNKLTNVKLLDYTFFFDYTSG